MSQDSSLSQADPEQEDDTFLNTLHAYAEEEAMVYPPIERRPECDRCRRPSTVCWCPFLPDTPVSIETRVYILQHPLEEQRKLRTAIMLYCSLEEGKCQIIKGRRFSPKRNQDLADMFSSERTLLLFPGPDAVDVRDLPPIDGGYNLVILDGTWTQAKGMYINNQAINSLTKVKIVHNCKSKYLIRTQPTDEALSTLESAAVAVSILENKPQLEELLTRPLEALVSYQMKHGAVQHQSKEQRIADRTWEKQLPLKLLKKREKEDKCAKETTTGNGS